MRRWESFQVANRLKAAHHWVQVILILSLIIGINTLALNHFIRYDLTESHRFALSPETRAYLAEIREPVQIVVTIPEQSPRAEEQVLFRYVEQLLREYAYQSRRSGERLITVEYVDIYKDLARADELAREHGLDQVNAILVRSGDRRRLVRADELITFENRRPVAFTGEAALTSAIVEVIQDISQKLYFLTGHDEVAPSDPAPRSGLSRISRELQMRNYSLQQLDLTTVNAVPEDAAVLILANPGGALLPSEIDKIRSYLFDRAGRVLLWTGPGTETGMDALLAEWGIHLPDQVVIEPDPAFRETTGTLLIRNYGEHRITESLIRNQTFVLTGRARPVIPRSSLPGDERLHVIPLFATSADSWAESTPESAGPPAFDSGIDLPGPVPVAAVAERRASSQLGIKVPGGRLAVFGSSSLFANRHINSIGNVSLFFNTLNWMLDRDRMLVIPPRPVQTYQLELSQYQLRQIALLFLVVPGFLAVCGFLVYWIRQS